MKIFAYICWIPLALWIAANVYVSRFEGWGAWAAAPVLVGPLVLSVLFGIFGISAYRREPSEQRRTVRNAVMVVLPWVPVVHVIVSKLWRSFV